MVIVVLIITSFTLAQSIYTTIEDIRSDEQKRNDEILEAKLIAKHYGITSINADERYKGKITNGEDGELSTETTTINLRDPKHKGAKITISADGSFLFEKPDVDYRIRGKDGGNELRIDPSRGIEAFDVGKNWDIKFLTITKESPQLVLTIEGKKYITYTKERGIALATPIRTSGIEVITPEKRAKLPKKSKWSDGQTQFSVADNQITKTIQLKKGLISLGTATITSSAPHGRSIVKFDVKLPAIAKPFVNPAKQIQDAITEYYKEDFKPSVEMPPENRAVFDEAVYQAIAKIENRMQGSQGRFPLTQSQIIITGTEVRIASLHDPRNYVILTQHMGLATTMNSIAGRVAKEIPIH